MERGAWRAPGPWRYGPWGHKALDTTEQLNNNKADSKIYTEAQMPRITKPIIKRKNNVGRFTLQTSNLLQSYNKLGFLCSSEGKASICNAGEPGLIPGLGGSPGVEKGNPPQYSSLENSMKKSWQATVHGAAKSEA